MFNKLDEEDPCVYFDLIVAINTLNSMVDALSCSNFESDASGSFSEVLPKRINMDDLEFRMDGLYTIKYPQDFKKFKHGPKGKGDLMFASILSLDEEFVI